MESDGNELGGLMPINKESLKSKERVNLNFLIQSAIWNCNSYAHDQDKYVIYVRQLERLMRGVMSEEEREEYRTELAKEKLRLVAPEADGGEALSGSALLDELSGWKFTRLTQSVAKAKADESPDEIE